MHIMGDIGKTTRPSVSCGSRVSGKVTESNDTRQTIDAPDFWVNAGLYRPLHYTLVYIQVLSTSPLLIDVQQLDNIEPTCRSSAQMGRIT
jgi:hypothetical protein